MWVNGWNCPASYLFTYKENEVTLTKPALAFMALTLAVPVLHAETAQPASTGQATVAAINPAAIQALKDMGNDLQALKRFKVATELTGERVLADGQKLQHSASAVLYADRPNKMRARMISARNERELVYDGTTVTLYAPAQKSYSTTTFSGSLDELVNRLEQRYGIDVPLSDLFSWGTPLAPLDKIESAMNAGQDFIGDDLCDHYAFRQGNIDWQVWISVGTRKLPRKLVITNRTDEARPQSISLIEWQLKPTFSASTFKFTPPKGSTAVELRVLDQK